MLLGRRPYFVVNCLFVVSLFAIESFPHKAAAADACAYVPGTKKDANSPCDASVEDVVKAASKRIAERIDEGTAPNPAEITALKTLVGNAQKLLLRDPSGAVPKDRISQQIDTLGAAVTAYPRESIAAADATAIDDKLKTLVRALFVWIAGSQSGSFNKYAAALDGYLKDPNVEGPLSAAFGYGLPNDFSTLISTSLDKAKADSTRTLVSSSTALSGFADQNKSAVDADSDVLVKALFDDTTGLIARLHNIEDKSGRPARIVLRRATALSSVLEKAIDEGNDAKKKEARIIREALARSDVMAKLSAIQEQTTKLTEPFVPKIHIIRAWYGHLGQRWSEGKQCSATLAVQNKCERQTSCSVDPISNGSLLDPVKLCGFDPAPVARGLARGLVVEYSCETGDFWMKPPKAPRPADGEPYTGTNFRTAVLRSSAMALNCSFPVAQAK